MKIETYLNRHFDGDLLAITGCRLEAPCFDPLDGPIVQVHARRSVDSDSGDIPGLVHDDIQERSRLVFGFCGFFAGVRRRCPHRFRELGVVQAGVIDRLS
jgi:hypothetical protein